MGAGLTVRPYIKQNDNIMKKILCALGLTLLIASCTGDYTDWADPKTSEPEETGTVTLAVANAADIDYATVTADSIQLFVPTITSTDTQATTSYTAVMYNNDKSANVIIATNAAGYASVADIQAAVEKLYGKAPTPRTVAMDIKALTNIGGASITSSGTATIKVTLVAPPIDSAYYLIGDMTGWDPGTVLQFAHDGAGTVFDNPTFSVVFNTTADSQYWKIIPFVNYNDPANFWAEGPTGVLGTAVNGDAAASGNLTTTAPQAGMITSPGYYFMLINMIDYSYSITQLNSISIIGSVKGNWDTDVDLTYNPETGAWEATTDLTAGAMKFRVNHDWALAWGAATSGENLDNLTLGNLSTINGQDITLNTAGTYLVQLFLSYGGTNQVVLTPQ